MQNIETNIENKLKSIHKDEAFKKLVLTNHYDQLLWTETELESFWMNCEEKEEIIDYVDNQQNPKPSNIIKIAQEEGYISASEAEKLNSMYNKLINFLIKTKDNIKGDEFKQEKLTSTSKTILNNSSDMAITTYLPTISDSKKSFSKTYDNNAQLPNQKAIY